ncbi:unknown protein [Microcystis aeruginosa NIES-843]|uniref:Uncharacterized protein n=1 Tax=Microcystis aeruginosa (strain NIES-843 / IAM M-2473) TaxID=449447 RepID=B0JG88_MICAN|nr:unknown protein [Microcystis aeruginosa NIES-843]
MYITLVFINVSPQSAIAPPRSQIKQQPNTKGGQNNNTHSPPHNCIKSYKIINLYIPLPSSDSLGTIEILGLRRFRSAKKAQTITGQRVNLDL